MCWGPDNMLFSSDIMGGANDNIEAQGGGISLFINGDAGDISPTDQACNNMPNYDGGHTIANTAMSVRAGLQTYTDGVIQTASATIEYGHTQTNWTLARNLNCTSGGPLDICSICEIIGCDLNLEVAQSKRAGTRPVANIAQCILVGLLGHRRDRSSLHGVQHQARRREYALCVDPWRGYAQLTRMPVRDCL